MAECTILLTFAVNQRAEEADREPPPPHITRQSVFDMIHSETVESLVAELLEAEFPKHYIVEVAVHPGNRIVVELGSGAGMAIDDCVRISKYVEARLDREVEDYELEVGSAGLTSPFKVLRQYEEAVGQDVEVLVKGGIKEKGTLMSATSGAITLKTVRRIKPEGAKRKVDVEEIITIPMTEILSTKRLLVF